MPALKTRMIIDQMLLISINKKYLPISVARSALFNNKQRAKIEIIINTGNFMHSAFYTLAELTYVCIYTYILWIFIFQ